MSTLYPGGTDSFTNPTGGQFLNSPDHAGQHTNSNDAMVAVQATLGSNSGTSVLKNFTAGQFPVRVTGGGAVGTLQQTIVGGTLNNTTIGTPTFLGGVLNNISLGTPTITGGTSTTQIINNATLGTPTFNAGAIPTAALAANAVTQSGGTSGLGLSQTITTVDSTTTDITGGSITLVTTGNPCLVIGYTAITMNVTSSYGIVYLIIDGAQTVYAYAGVGSVNAFQTIPITYLSTPAAGTHTWKFGGAVAAGGTMGIRSISLNVIELKK